MDRSEHDLQDLLSRPTIRRLWDTLGERGDVVVTVCDTSGTLLWGTAAGSRRLFDRTPGDYAGRNRFDFLHPDDVQRCRDLFEQAVSGESVSYTSRAAAADGTWRTVAVLEWPTDGPEGPVVLTITLPEAGPDEGLAHLEDLRETLGQRTR